MVVKRIVKLMVVFCISVATAAILMPTQAAEQVLLNLSGSGNHYETVSTIPLTAGQVVTVTGLCTPDPRYNAPIEYVHYIEIGAVPTAQNPQYNESIYYRRVDCTGTGLINWTIPASTNYRFIFHVHTTEYGCAGGESCSTVTGISHFNYTLRVTSNSTGTAPTATATRVSPSATPTATVTRVSPSATPTATATRVSPSATPTATRVSPSATPTATATRVPPTATPASSGSVTVRITSGTDDVNEVGTTFDPSSSTVWIGNGGTTTTSFTGLRFGALNIPRGATIVSAQLQFYSAQQTWIGLNLQIAGELAANSQAFSSSSRPSQRTALTTARVNHSSNVNWNANTWYTLADVRSIVQEVVNQPSWTAGNRLALILRGTGSSWGRKFVTSYEGNAANAVRLVITYSS